ncbi:MAG: DedA family protein [Acidobacteriota bacterium]
MHWIGPENVWLAFAVLFMAGLLEYLFPPVPGDTTMLLGFFLVGRGELPLWLAFSACFLGCTVGALLAYGLGARLGQKYFFLRRSRRAGSMRAVLERWFDRYGARVLMVNRFLPGVRAFFLFLAGMRRLPLGEVLLYCTISNLALLILFAFLGTQLGENWQHVRSSFRSIFLGAGLLLLGGVITWLVIVLRQRREPLAES